MWPRQRKHTQLVKASWNRVLLEYLRLVLGDKASNKMKLIPMANDTTKTRMNELPDSIKGQVVSKILSSPFFVLQLDESTDVANIAQLLVYCSYITTKVFKQHFLSCRALQTTTKGDDVIAVLTGFFKVTGLVGPFLLGLVRMMLLQFSLYSHYLLLSSVLRSGKQGGHSSPEKNSENYVLYLS